MKNQTPKIPSRRGSSRKLEPIPLSVQIKNSHLSPVEMAQQIHQLEVKQVELEMQNNQLIQARNTILEAAEKYMELYDFAPMGYLSLDREGTILEINICASRMLGVEKNQLVKNRFTDFLGLEHQPRFLHFLQGIFQQLIRDSCELKISPNGITPFYARLTATIGLNENRALLTLVDITEQKKAEFELEKWATLFKTNQG